jgi:type III secretory pathway component EscS
MRIEDIQDLMRKLTFIGGIVAIAQGAWNLVNISFKNPVPVIVGGTITIVLGIIALLTILRTNRRLPFNWTVLLIISILLFIFGGWIGGIIILIAAILGIIEEFR